MSAILYGSLVLHNFIVSTRDAALRAKAEQIVAHSHKAAHFGRLAASHARVYKRQLGTHDLHNILVNF